LSFLTTNAGMARARAIPRADCGFAPLHTVSVRGSVVRLLVLDEPTSGLDPIVRREFIETVSGAYQETAPRNRTIFA
jgi:ABC-type transporter Mla maintaining outer membrane lipid asymmetry ATPase subunit MlaF